MNNTHTTALLAALLLATGTTDANDDYQHYDGEIIYPDAPQPIQSAQISEDGIIYLDEQADTSTPPVQVQIDEESIIYPDETRVTQTVQTDIVYLNEAELAASGIIYLDETPIQTPQLASATQPVAVTATQPPQRPQHSQAFWQTPLPTADTAMPQTQGSGYEMYADTSGSSDQTGDTATLQPVTPSTRVSTATVIKAVESGRIDLLSVLQTKGADLRKSDAQGLTYLHRAAAKGHLEMVQYLLRAGLNPNVVTTKDWTPLHHAARFGHADIVTALLAAGADPRQQTVDGFSPQQLALNVDKRQVAALLR